MDIIRKDQNFEAQFTLDEIRFIHQALNEVCHGLHVANLETRVGDINTAKREMKDLGDIYENAKDQQVNVPVRIFLDTRQAQLYRNVLQIVCEEIEEWEFQTRTGETRNRAKEIQAELEQLTNR